MRVGLRFQVVQLRFLFFYAQLLGSAFQFYMIIDVPDDGEK